MPATAVWVVAGALLGIPTLAEEAPPRAETEETVQTTGGERPTAPADAGTTDEVFIPTEEISEDFAVAFPVDI